MAKVAHKPLYIGLMSGTSIDAVDAVLVHITDKIKIIERYSTTIPQQLKDSILALCVSGDNEIQRAFELDRELGLIFSDCALALCAKAKISPSNISAIGSHGQTIRHSPHGKQPFTLQISDPNTIAEITGITTVADFRRRDIAAGGQGAPLVPAFHENVFRSFEHHRAIVNIGGMANVTLVAKSDATTPTLGFDTGPGNVLLDYWIYKHKNQQFDYDGQWAASGDINPELLNHLLSEPYLRLLPPKSTGRELFNSDWLEQQLLKLQPMPEEDVQATLVEFTCQTIADSIAMCDSQLPRNEQIDEIYICGGGAKNGYIMSRLDTLLRNKNVATTQLLGIAPELVESIAFAWLAHRTINQLSGNLSSVTGAKQARVLGAIYCGN